MKRINPIWLYRLGGATRIFARFTPETKYGDVQGWNDFRTDCGFAYVWLNWLLDHPEIPLVDCHEAAQYLKHFLVSTGNYAPDELLGAERHHVVKFHFDQFQTQLETELAKTNIYHVTKVNAYDTDTLLSKGKMALPGKIVDKMGADSLKCFEEGTRCLGLGLATSAGFQLLRSVEGVMHNFYDVLSNSAPRPAKRNMGDYIAEMENLPSVDRRMLDVLRGIKNLRRNPLMHPEDFLDMDDALVTFDVVKSAISTMVILAEEHKQAAKGTP